ncbi:hypothetical protein PIB30_094058 [Stylosanthes scabra]|uniref:PB1-like domain-containing protein n=1 Tax=Stylosanthes scabra TaxID=79078 RepID=A0ABU6VUK1_9FABA|nr:hypothetical protein [Stylosanthes scabra]
MSTCRSRGVLSPAKDLGTLCEGLGYKKFKDLFWYDITAPEMETGLNKLVSDEGIRELIGWLTDNEEKEFHMYVEHVVDKPILAEKVEEKKGETVNLVDSSSSSDDGYEPDEEEAYKPPPSGDENSKDEEGFGVEKGGKRGKGVDGEKTEACRKDNQTKGKGISRGANKKTGGGTGAKNKNCGGPGTGPSVVGPEPGDEHGPNLEPNIGFGDEIPQRGRPRVRVYQPELFDNTSAAGK